jgi:hypothetical protein
VIAVPLVLFVALRDPQPLDWHDNDQLMLPPPTVWSLLSVPVSDIVPLTGRVKGGDIEATMATEMGCPAMTSVRAENRE